MGSNQKHLPSRTVDELNQRWGAVESVLRAAVLQGTLPSSSAAQHVRAICAQADGMGRVAQLWLLTRAEKVIKKTMKTFFSSVKTTEDILPALETMTIDVSRLLSAARWLETQCQNCADVDDEAMGDEPAEYSFCKNREYSSGHGDDSKKRVALENELLDAVSRISGTQITPQFDALMLQLFQRSFRAFHKTQ
ncbi:hypothetical protein BIW11_09461, partial [Tropilaelaps mercedesae]